MNHVKTLSTVVLLTAIGCGGKLLDMPPCGYCGGDAAEGDDGATNGGASSGAGSSGGQNGSSGGASSSSSGGTGPAATCGGAKCGKGEVCCINPGGGGGGGGVGTGAAQACTAAGACKGLSISCTDAAGCATGEVCCFMLNLAGFGGGAGGGGISGTATCMASCGTGVGTFQLCSTNAECPKGVTCQATGYGGNACGGTGGLGGGGGIPGGAGGGVPGGAGAGAGGAGFFCTSPETPIMTPQGERPIASLHVGDVVLSVDHGQVRAVPLVEVHRQPVVNHHVVSATLADGRVIHISEGHPTADHRFFRDLAPGDKLGDVTVVSVESIAYDHDATYDILPGSDTGTYFAAGALIGSTLR